MSALETFVEFLKNLEHQWGAFMKKSENEDEKNLQAEFDQLIAITLDSYLDVSYSNSTMKFIVLQSSFLSPCSSEISARFLKSTSFGTRSKSKSVP